MLLEEIKISLNGKEIPLIDAPIDVCKTEIEKMSWQEAQHYSGRFLPRAYGEWAIHDKILEHLFWERLFRLELPILHLQEEDKKDVLWVDQGASSQKIKDLVACEMNADDDPKLVVEYEGKLRGFALSPSFIVVGCTATFAFPGIIRKCVAKWNVQLPTEEDAALLMKKWHKLQDMMQKVGVPDLRGVEIFLLSLSYQRGKGYLCWLTGYTTPYYVESETAVFLLAKL